jgi:hypothetical protein
MLFRVDESFSIIYLDFVKIMQGEKNVDFVLLIGFDLLLDFDIFTKLKVAGIHDKIVIMLTDDSIDEVIGLE